MRSVTSLLIALCSSTGCGSGGGGAPDASLPAAPDASAPAAPDASAPAPPDAAVATMDPGHLGAFEVGSISLTLTDASRADRRIRLLIHYPAAAATGSPAVYDQWPFPFTVSSNDWVASVNKAVWAGADVAPGTHPALLFSSGGGGAIFSDVYAFTRYASHGFIVIGMTHTRECNVGTCMPQHPYYTEETTPDPQPVRLRQRMLDARLVLDAALDCQRPPGDLLCGRIDAQHLFLGGYSIGGAAAIALTSRVKAHDDLEPEGRVKALAPILDATREALSLEQVEGNELPAFLHTQHCARLQLDLQRHLGGAPRAVGLVGFTAPTLAGAISNHRLFSQVCMTAAANAVAGNPFPPPAGFPCADASYVALEKRFADVVTKHTIAFLKTQVGEEAYAQWLVRERIDEDGVRLIEDARAFASVQAMIDALCPDVPPQ
jgi:hypothetical protein